MHKNVLWRYVIALLALVANDALGDQTNSKNYVLFPVKSELENHLLGSADAFVEVNGNAFAADETLQLERLDVDGFRTELVTLRKGLDSEATIMLYLRFAGVSVSDTTHQKLEAELTEICRNAGFAKVRTASRYEAGEWDDKLNRLKAVKDEDASTPSAVDHELVRVFAVRTRLARYILGDVDCYVDLKQPIDGRFTDFPKTVRKQIIQSVASFKISSKKAMMCRFLATTAGRKSVKEFFGGHPLRPSPAKTFAEEMGFTHCLYSMTTMGVSPEDLLGKKVPGFTLESLTGGELNLHEAIAGRAAIVSFWGVACGGCRIEAPHLTKLHETYGGKGLAVVAVNGYDESREVVKAYAEKAGLTHPIVLQGSGVAKDKFTVMSYPVTFLIDHKGIVRDYHLGFEAGDEKQLFAKVSQLVQERERP